MIMVEVIGTFHTTLTWAQIYYLHLRGRGYDLNKIDSNSPIGQKLLREFQRIPQPQQTPADAVISHLSKMDLFGKKVGLEAVHDEVILDEVDRIRGVHKTRDHELDFFREIAHYVELKGGEVVNQDRKDLYESIADAEKMEKWHHRTHIRRTVHMVNPSTNGPIDFLVTGIAHADHVKTLLGKDAHVTMICPKILRREYATEHRMFRRHVQRAKPRTLQRLRERMKMARRPRPHH